METFAKKLCGLKLSDRLTLGSIYFNSYSGNVAMHAALGARLIDSCTSQAFQRDTVKRLIEFVIDGESRFESKDSCTYETFLAIANMVDVAQTQYPISMACDEQSQAILNMIVAVFASKTTCETGIDIAQLLDEATCQYLAEFVENTSSRSIRRFRRVLVRTNSIVHFLSCKQRPGVLKKSGRRRKKKGKKAVHFSCLRTVYHYKMDNASPLTL